MRALDGCGDGNCVIRRPKGQHTNGGCRCVRDLRFQENQTKFREEMVLIRAVVEAATAFWQSDKGDTKREARLFEAVEALEKARS